MTASRQTAADLAAIEHCQTIASTLLAGNLNSGRERGEAALAQLVEHDVPRLLVDLEQRQVDSDEGYVRGLHAAARWLAMFDQDLPDFDRATCQRLAAGMRAMAASAGERLGVEGSDGQPEPAGDVPAAAGLGAACKAVTP